METSIVEQCTALVEALAKGQELQEASVRSLAGDVNSAVRVAVVGTGACTLLNALVGDFLFPDVGLTVELQHGWTPSVTIGEHEHALQCDPATPAGARSLYLKQEMARLANIAFDTESTHFQIAYPFHNPFSTNVLLSTTSSDCDVLLTADGNGSGKVLVTGSAGSAECEPHVAMLSALADLPSPEREQLQLVADLVDECITAAVHRRAAARQSTVDKFQATVQQVAAARDQLDLYLDKLTACASALASSVPELEQFAASPPSLPAQPTHPWKFKLDLRALREANMLTPHGERNVMLSPGTVSDAEDSDAETDDDVERSVVSAAPSEPSVVAPDVMSCATSDVESCSVAPAAVPEPEPSPPVATHPQQRDLRIARPPDYSMSLYVPKTQMHQYRPAAKTYTPSTLGQLKFTETRRECWSRKAQPARTYTCWTKASEYVPASSRPSTWMPTQTECKPAQEWIPQNPIYFEISNVQ